MYVCVFGQLAEKTNSSLKTFNLVLVCNVVDKWERLEARRLLGKLLQEFMGEMIKLEVQLTLEQCRGEGHRPHVQSKILV